MLFQSWDLISSDLFQSFHWQHESVHIELVVVLNCVVEEFDKYWSHSYNQDKTLVLITEDIETN